MTDDKVTIVMIEDDPGHARLIERNLRRGGLMNNLVHFLNGAEGLNYLFSIGADSLMHKKILVLLDLNLPDMDGYEILNALKENERTHALPIIILTTTDNPKEVKRCYDLGCNIYITKPVEYDKFCEAIAKLGLMLAVVKLPEVA